MKKNQNGITLIALVITIIVLLILAGVSIAMLTGDNGILNQATRARTDTAEAEVADKINMALNGEFANLLADQKLTTPNDEDEAKADETEGVEGDETKKAAVAQANAIIRANGLDDTYTVETKTEGDILKITYKVDATKNIEGKITKTGDKYTITKAEYPKNK